MTYTGAIPPVKLTGDIHLLVGFLFETAVNALNSEHAPALGWLTFNNSDIPVLNLSTHSELTGLTFVNTNIGDLILPEQHRITGIWIEPHASWPSTAELDYIISNIYNNVVAGSPTVNLNNGSVNLHGSAVSEQSATMLEDLQNTYGWYITY
jgi:hypothetical protein